MMTDAATFDEVTELPRAGFWRRLASITLDLIIVMLPFQMLAAVLFAATAGTVQMQNGFFSFCEHGGKDQISEQLRPLAPRDSNFITKCRTSFLGATTARRLIVGRATRDGNITTNVTNSFMQDQEGAVIKGTDIGWIFNLALGIYLVAMIWKRGKTIGARAVRIRVIDVTNPASREVPLRKAIVRYLVMFVGIIPGVTFFIYQYWSKGGVADAMFTQDAFMVFTACAVFGALWGLVLTVQIAKKVDPVYDRVAGTAVLRS